jgi:hypothetical protein
VTFVPSPIVAQDAAAGPEGRPIDRPQYRYASDGRFLPANAAARAECERWNAWASEVNGRAARRCS